MYFLGRLLKSFPLSGTEILLQSWRFLSLRLPPYTCPALVLSSANRPTVTGEWRRISLCVVDRPELDKSGRLGNRLAESDLGFPAVLLIDVDLEQSPVLRDDDL